MAAVSSPLDRSNVQKLILQPYPYPISRHFLFMFSDKQRARQFIAHWTAHVTVGAQSLDQFLEPLINVGLTWQGLIKAGAFDSIGGVAAARKAFFWDFQTPPHAASLGAVGASAPGHWWNNKFPGSDIDLLVHVFCRTESALRDITDKLRQSAEAQGVRELIPTRDGEAITGRQIDGRKLHFGYADSISHPAVNWDDEPDKPDLVYHRGSFLLGEMIEYPQSFPRSEDGPFFDLVKHGSYMAFVWIYQDVASFNRFLRENGPVIAPDLPTRDAEELLAAKLMGRWRDGSPLILALERPDQSLSMANEFGYAEDPKGLRCPLSAHIRIANRRDEPLDFANQTMFPAGFPRLLRRGTPYGPPLDGEIDDDVDRGVVGMFFCANIDRQFYTIMRWINKTDFSPVYTNPNGQDPLVGNRDIPGASNEFELTNGSSTIRLQGLKNFIRIQGVALTLVPSMSTLQSFAQ
jgi:deferrochelatase/peroxidase EfeB